MSASATVIGGVGTLTAFARTDASGHQRGFTADEINVGGYAQVLSVSCAPAGNCAAAGYYTDASGDSQVFVVSRTPSAGA